MIQLLCFNGDINSQGTGTSHKCKNISKINILAFLFSTVLEISCYYPSQKSSCWQALPVNVSRLWHFGTNFYLPRWVGAGGDFSPGFVPLAGDKYFSGFKTYPLGLCGNRSGTGSVLKSEESNGRLSKSQEAWTSLLAPFVSQTQSHQKSDVVSIPWSNNSRKTSGGYFQCLFSHFTADALLW